MIRTNDHSLNITELLYSDKTKIILFIIIYKLFFFCLAFISCHYGKLIIEPGVINIHIEKLSNISATEAPFCALDAKNYLSIVESGYKPDDGICAFYPLFPGLIWLFSKITGIRHFIVGMILSNIFSLIAFYQFYMFVYENYGKNAARWALAFLLIFPAAIFFQLIYTESLFLLFAVLFFRYLFKGKLLPAAIMAFFMPMTRAVGIFIILPLFYWLWTEKRPLKEYIALGYPLLGYGFYFCIMAYFTGNPFEGFVAQNNYPNQPSITNILNLNKFIISIFDVTTFHSSLNSAVDRIHFIIVIQALILVWMLDKRLFAYALLVGVIPAMSHFFWSYPRMVMMAFPIFIALAVMLDKPGLRWIRWYLAIPMGALNLYFILLHFNYRWTS